MSSINIDNRKIITHSSDNFIETFDLKGNLIQSIENKNVNTGSNKVSNNSKFSCFYFQGTKSHLVDIEKGKSQVLWAHETYTKGYYETFYANQVRDFSIHRVYFSPQDNYLIAGAFFDKNVAWTIPKCERFDLIPNEEYIDTLENVFFGQLEGKEFYINHGNYFLADVQFHDDGQFFSLHINNDTLFWNDKFNHLGTIYNSSKMKFLNDNYLVCLDDTSILFYEKVSPL